MARRRLTVRRIDPWSVLKFGAVANVVLLIIWLLVVGVIFYIVDRIGLVDQVCELVLDVGFEACGINGGNLFRAIALLGLLGVVILTAVAVFLSFLHNLIADLTGGLTFTVLDDSPVAQRPVTPAGPATTTGAGATGAGASGGAIVSARTPPADRVVRTTARGGTGSPPVPPIGADQDTVRHDPVPPRRPSGDGRDRGRGDGDDDLFGQR